MPLHKYIIILAVVFSACQKPDKKVVHQLDNWKFEYKGDWYKAEVPGNNFSDLLSHGFIPDPFYGTNEDSVQWVSEREWNYRTTFSPTKSNNQSLIFKGLDTYAKVYLNDSLILETDNMFRIYEVEVSNLLQAANTLQICFLPPHIEEKKKIKTLGYELPGGSRVFTRKAGFHYGWDWGPKITPSGIWRSVELQSWNTARITDFYIKQESLTHQKAKLSAEVELEIEQAGDYQLSINDSVYESTLSEGIHLLKLPYSISFPQRWWPVGFGKQQQYTFDFAISKDNKQVDKKSQKMGLRTIELVTEKEDIGESFYFKVNGKAIFMKGANYIPQDNLQNRVTKQHYRNLLLDVIDANMNMLRVWGGGIYEEDIFYDLCDSLGILVWQDFMFACAMYPSDSLFLENVKEEAVQNVKRLRNHPCIALWCGNNENSEGWHRWGWQDAYTEKQQEEIWKGYQKVFQEILPSTTGSCFYWDSSPKFGRGDARHQFEGDAHYWGVWHDAEPFENFQKKVPRFMSVFGFQSFPEFSTIAKFADSSQWYLNSDVMKSHQKHPRGNNLILEYMQREYPVLSDFKKFVYVSHILQAEGMRIGMEAHRRSQPYCMGTLYWQLNDCWPVASWSSRDYYGNWKALHYTAQDVFAPVSLSLEKKEKQFNVWVISDTTNTLDTLIINTYKLSGDMVAIAQKPISIKVGSNLIESIPFCKEDEFIICSLKAQKVETKVGFTQHIKSYDFPKPNIKVKWEADQLILSTDTPVFQLYLHGIEEKFSDNFFTLLPEKEKRVTIKGNKFNPNKLLIWSLYDLKN